MINTELMNLLEKAMDGSTMRHATLSNNLANVNTPGFKRGDVSFRSSLDEAIGPKLPLKRTSPLHLKNLDQRSESELIIDSRASLRNDGNNVDVDVELATMAENNLYFNSLAQLLSSQLSVLRQAIAEGR